MLQSGLELFAGFIEYLKICVIKVTKPVVHYKKAVH